jgi:hypothetical protein
LDGVGAGVELAAGVLDGVGAGVELAAGVLDGVGAGVELAAGVWEGTGVELTATLLRVGWGALGLGPDTVPAWAGTTMRSTAGLIHRAGSSVMVVSAPPAASR